MDNELKDTLKRALAVAEVMLKSARTTMHSVDHSDPHAHLYLESRADTVQRLTDRTRYLRTRLAEIA